MMCGMQQRDSRDEADDVARTQCSLKERSRRPVESSSSILGGNEGEDGAGSETHAPHAHAHAGKVR